MGADNRVAAVHVIFAIEKMHGAAETLGASSFFSEQLRHTGVSARPFDQGMRVVAIRRDEIIIMTRGRKSSDHDRFLPNVEMTKAADLLRLILLAGALFKAPKQQHQREHFDLVALPRLHGNHAVREIASRECERSKLRPKFTLRTKRKVKKKLLTNELRKN